MSNSTIVSIDLSSGPGLARKGKAGHPRYAVGPLIKKATTMLGRTVTLEEVGAFLGMSQATTYRRQKDGFTEEEADQVACGLALLHPCLIWPEWWANAEDAEVMCDDVALCA